MRGVVRHPAFLALIGLALGGLGWRGWQAERALSLPRLAAADGLVFVLDPERHRLFGLRPRPGGGADVSLLVGKTDMPGEADGPGAEARLGWASDVAADPRGGAPVAYLAEANRGAVRRVAVGEDGRARVTTVRQAGRPIAVSTDGRGGLCIVDGTAIRALTPAGGDAWRVTTLVDTRDPDPGEALAVTPDGRVFFEGLRRGRPGDPASWAIAAVALDRPGQLACWPFGWGQVDGPWPAARFRTIVALVPRAAGSLWIVEQDGIRVLRYDEHGPREVIPGLAPGEGPRPPFETICDAAAGADGTLYVADAPGGTVRVTALRPRAGGVATEVLLERPLWHRPEPGGWPVMVGAACRRPSLVGAAKLPCPDVIDRRRQGAV